MMMKTAGGPAVSPIDYGERKKPIPRWMVFAVGASILVHGGVAVWLYTQRFEAPVIAPPDDAPPPVVVTFERVRPPERLKPTKQRPPAPTTRLNETPAPTTPTEVLSIPVADGPPADGPVITLSETPIAQTPGPVTSTPVETPPAPPVIRNPAWISKPSGDQLMNAYPERAIERGIGGVASLSCLVRADGSVTTCSVNRETPNGYGFGRAALGLTRWFRLSPRTVDGRAVEGSRVTMDIRFTPPPE